MTYLRTGKGSRGGIGKKEAWGHGLFPASEGGGTRSKKEEIRQKNPLIRGKRPAAGAFNSQGEKRKIGATAFITKEEEKFSIKEGLPRSHSSSLK